MGKIIQFPVKADKPSDSIGLPSDSIGLPSDSIGSPSDSIGSPSDSIGLPSDKDKLRVVEACLKQGVTLVRALSGYEGVEIPGYLKAAKWVILNFSYNFGTDVDLSGKGIRQYLSFGPDRGWFEVFIPWGAVSVVRACNGDIHIWTEEFEDV